MHWKVACEQKHISSEFKNSQKYYYRNSHHHSLLDFWLVEWHGRNKKKYIESYLKPDVVFHFFHIERIHFIILFAYKEVHNKNPFSFFLLLFFWRNWKWIFANAIQSRCKGSRVLSKKKSEEIITNIQFVFFSEMYSYFIHNTHTRTYIERRLYFANFHFLWN